MGKQIKDINGNMTNTTNNFRDENEYIYLNDNALLLPKLSLLQASLVTTFLALLCFWNTQNASFTFDDNSAILQNKDIQTSSSTLDIFNNDFWGTKLVSKVSHKSYRPLTVLTFKLNYILADGYKPWGFHFINVCLHALNSAFLLRIFSILFGGNINNDTFNSPKASLLCGILFAVHPIHTESVAAVVGRADLLCTFFFLTSFICYVNFCDQHLSSDGLTKWRNLLFCLLSAFISMFCKEQGLTVLGLCIAYDILIIFGLNIEKIQSFCRGFKTNESDIKVLKRVCIMVLATVLMLLIRLVIMGSTTPAFQYYDNPHSFQPTLIFRVINYTFLYTINIWILLAPVWLCFDWSMGCIPVITVFNDPRIIFPLIMLVVMTLLALKVFLNMNCLYARTIALGFGFLIVPFIPAMNIFFRVGFVIAERNLYISSIGFVLIIVSSLLLILSSSNTLRKVVNVLTVAVVVVSIGRSIQRSYDWMDEESLFNSALQVCPLNAKVHYNIGKINQDNEKADEAIKNYLEAIKLYPEYDQPMNNLGNIYKDKGLFKEAEFHLENAVRVSPKFSTGWMNLATVKTELKKREEAIDCYQNAIKFRRNYPDAYFNWGNLHLHFKEFDEALLKYKTAIDLKNDHYQSWQNTILLLGEMRRASELKKLAKVAVRYFPKDYNMYNAIGNALGQGGDFLEAKNYLKKSLRLNPHMANTYGNLGVVHHRLKEYDEALKNYEKSLKIDPGNKLVKENYLKLKKLISNS